MKKVLLLLVTVMTVFMLSACVEKEGLNGIDGINGLDGINGIDGLVGNDGEDG